MKEDVYYQTLNRITEAYPIFEWQNVFIDGENNGKVLVYETEEKHARIGWNKEYPDHLRFGILVGNNGVIVGNVEYDDLKGLFAMAEYLITLAESNDFDLKKA